VQDAPSGAPSAYLTVQLRRQADSSCCGTGAPATPR
jgi:hypothetical protein